MTRHKLSASVPAQPFFATDRQRQALARQRFFEEGDRPSGLVSEVVIQSWSRCMQARRGPSESLSFNSVTRSRIHSVLSRNRLLLDAAADELMRLEIMLAGTGCRAMLTDANGVLVHATRSSAIHDQLLPLASRVGINLAEECVGTTAPGMVVRTGQPCTVRAAEHFFECLQTLHCVAAPIRDVRQQVVGVLDVSIESQPFGFDAASMVALHATSIENRLLQAQSCEHIVIRLQSMPTLLRTPMEGLAGVNSEGMLTWLNGAAARLLGVPQVGPWMRLNEVFGLEPRVLAALTRRVDATMHRLPNGLAVWLLAHMQSADGAEVLFSLRDPREEAHAAAKPELAIAPEITPTPPADLSDLREETRATAEPELAIAAPEIAPTPPASLRESDQKLVERTVAECGGNVSRAARALGVSRGLVYRHLNRPRLARVEIATTGAQKTSNPAETGEASF